ncbi:carboxypeptidase-like regulatory domain-containing protein [Fluviicola sp.]|uniref:carboxypeptidase-like regulatory domain-containing protein n=1 Tax=Fluviicola sp. TaxID=1917219 RepID=UPI00262E47A8|nr:carboxypeptidase-like regulatory domain-containing protein [Fluviicola sp.]
MKQNYLIAILLLLFFTAWISGSNSTWSQAEVTVKGKVVSEMGTPIKNATVKLGSADGRTNSNGFFILKNSTFPVQLTVKHPLFSEYIDMVVFPQRWRDTLEIFVVMTGKETELEEVTVTNRQLVWVYPRKQANVLDFVLQPDDGIILCCSDEKTYFMRGLNSQGEKMYEIPIRRHPKELFRDCTQRVHLIYSDSIYETSVISNTMGLFQIKSASKLFLYNLLKSCVYKDNKTLVKYYYSDQNQRIEFLAYNIQTQKPKTIYVSEDRKRNRQLREFAMENRDRGDDLFHTSDKDQLKMARARWENLRFYDLVLTTPVYVPLFELNDSLVIFDHLNDSAVVFTKAGDRVRSFPILYHHYKGWKNELVTNMEKTKIYARYEIDGLTILREINPENGKIERLIRLETHIFPKHLQIRDGYIYYIYNDYLDQSMHYLFKQALKQ